MLIYYPCDFCAFLSEESTGIDFSPSKPETNWALSRGIGLTATGPVGPLGAVGLPVSPVGPAGPKQPVGPLEAEVGPPGAKQTSNFPEFATFQPRL